MRARTRTTKMTTAIGMLSTWAMGFGMGLGALAISSVGEDERLPARGVAPRPIAHASAAAPEPVTCREDEAAWSAALDGLSANLRLAAQVADLESALSALRTGAIDGPSFVRAAVHSMPEHEIKDVLAATTKLDADHLDGIEDIQGYAMRLADIAMEGVLAEETEAAPGVVDVEFSARQDGRRSNWATADTFDAGEDRLYAFFDTTDWPSGEVMVRWRHVESGDVLLLEQHRVRSGVPRGFVWYSPSGSWDAGVYQVDVYSDDEGLGHLASGRYAVN